MMACYRNGGCGPYEMRSCSECPASKPEYAVRQAIIKARPWEPQDLIDDLQLIIDEEPDRYTNIRREILCMARDYLKEFFGIEQEPLTIEELQQMVGEPVWAVYNGVGRWCIVDGGLLSLTGHYGISGYLIAYKHKPGGQ